MTSTHTTGTEDLIYVIVKEHYIISHNTLKQIVVKKKKSMSDTTFEKYLHLLVADNRVFKIPEVKVRMPVSMIDENGGEEVTYIKSKGRPHVYYTTQKRLIHLKPNFTEFCKTQMEFLNNQLTEFQHTVGTNPSENEIIDRINKFSTSLFVLRNMINSVNILLNHWQDFRFELEQWFVQIEVRQVTFYGYVRDHYPNIYEKILSESQLSFLKSNEIHPYNTKKK